MSFLCWASRFAGRQLRSGSSVPSHATALAREWSHQEVMAIQQHSISGGQAMMAQAAAAMACTRLFTTSSSVQQAKAKKAPGEKRPKSAYMRFVAERFADVRRELGDAKATDVTRALGAKWKALSDHEKAPYQEAAAREKEEWESRNPKQPKEKKPKGPLTAWMRYLTSEFASVQAANPGLPLGGISKLISERWKGMSDAARAPYVRAAAEEKAAFNAAKKA